MPWRIDFPGAARLYWPEFASRILCIALFILTEELNPFHRVILPEEAYMYKYPYTVDVVISTPALYIIAISSCLSIIFIFLVIRRDFRESLEGLLVPSLALPLTGFLTNVVKLTVGRPRPDYFARCYPEGFPLDGDISKPCGGDMDSLIEGRKSFPSGHSSISFCAFGFVALYMAGKLNVFNRRGRGESYRLILCIIPVMCAILIAISRTCDYRHHWQDVTIGGLVGSLISYIVYRQYYPSLSSTYSEMPYVLIQRQFGSNQIEFDETNPIKII